jgi:hypothetical protein
MKPMKLPFTLGSCVSVSLVMFPPISFEVTSTSGVPAVTVRSLHAARIHRHVDGGGAADLELEIATLERLEPLQRGRDLMAARVSALAMKAPPSPDSVSRNIPVPGS